MVSKETIEELIKANQTLSVSTYLRRQELELNRQRLNLEIIKVEQELLMLDGEMRILERLKNE